MIEDMTIRKFAPKTQHDYVQARGTPLAGLAVKLADGFFLVGLSNGEVNRARNLQLLKERSWFDVPLVYANQRRAIIAFEKGAPGERAFNEALVAWGKAPAKWDICDFGKEGAPLGERSSLANRASVSGTALPGYNQFKAGTPQTRCLSSFDHWAKNNDPERPRRGCRFRSRKLVNSIQTPVR
jgi:hypothetical protein